jgi:hypothetical protein
VWRVHVPLRRAGGAVFVAIALTIAAIPAAAQAANIPPRCYGATTAVEPGTARTFALRCATDWDGPELPQVEIVGQPAHGHLGVVAGLSVRYEAPAQAGDDSFTFRVTDGANQSPTITQELRITGENLAPRCLPLDVVANPPFGVTLDTPCYDPNAGDAVRPMLAEGEAPSHGEVFVGDSVQYSPDPSYQGPDAFSLRATDGTLTGPATQVDVSVEPRTPPDCDAPATIPVRPGTTNRFSPRCRDNSMEFHPESFSYSLVDEPAHGQVEPDFRGGTFEYTPDEGYTGPDTYTFRASTHFGGVGPSTITVTLQVSEDANAAPVCQPVGLVLVRSGATASLGTPCYDTDRDAVDPIYDPLPSHGALAGRDYQRTYTADEDYAGRDDFAVRWTDGQAETAPATQRVRVLGDAENTAPQCAGTVRRVRRDQTAPFAFACLDSDEDPLTYTWEDPAHGSVAPHDGGFPFGGRYLLYTPEEGYAGPDRVVVTARDDHGGVTRITHLVDVVAPQAPDCPTRAPAEVRPGRTLTLVVRCPVDEMPVNGQIKTGPAHGTMEDQGGGWFVYRPAAGFTGHDSITFEAHNDAGSDEYVQEIEVTDAANQIPQCTSSYKRWTRGEPVEVAVQCYDADQDPVTLTTVDTPDHGSVGAWDQATKKILYTPGTDYVGLDSFAYRANDGRADTETLFVTIRLRAPDANYRPRCLPGWAPTDPGTAVTFEPTCTDEDGDPLTLGIVEQPEHGTATGPDGAGKLTYTPEPGFEGEDVLRFRASDGQVSSLTQTYDVQVGPPPPFPPSLPHCRPIAANVRHATPRRVRLVCSAPFGDPVAPEIVDGPDHGALGGIGDDGRVTYTPAAGFTGTDTFTYRGSGGGENISTVELRVGAPPQEENPPPPDPPQPDPPQGDPPPPNEVPKGPPPPPGDPFEAAVESKLGGDAVMAEGLPLAGNRVYVPLTSRGGTVKVDAAVEKLLAVVCQSPCDVTATEQLTLTGAKARAAAAKRMRLRTQRLKLKAGQPGVVTLKLTKAQRRRIRRARRATLTVKIAVRDTLGPTRRATLRFRVRSR